MTARKSPIERLMSQVKVSDKVKCWPWTGPLHSKRYGKFYLDGHHLNAHRALWIILNGEIQKGVYVLHSCDVPKCVNPFHLFLGSPQDNMDDMRAKGRQNFSKSGLHQRIKKFCKYGHPYDEDNTYLRPDGGRDCYQCLNRRTKAYQSRRRLL